MAVQKSRGWNLFARELEDILASRGLHLGHLDNRAAIHPQRVRRLQQSLNVPYFHVLPPEDIESISEALNLTPAEVVRLKAALLATAIEQKLMNRINREDALIAAEQLIPLLTTAIHQHDGEPAGIGQIKAGEGDVTSQLTPREQLDAALELLDSAFTTLNLAREVTGVSRSNWARDAQEDFRAAIPMLHALNDDLRDTDAWRMWYEAAQRGLQQARELLA